MESFSVTKPATDDQLAKILPPVAPATAPGGKGGGRADLPASTVELVALDKIHASPFNPRKDFAKEGLAELADSIRERGLQQNLTLRPHPKKAGHYELMGGERRWRALQTLKAEGAMCKITTATDAEALATQIVENLQRADLKPLEEAASYVALQKMDPKKWTAAAIGRSIGKSDRFVAQRMALVTRLDPGFRKMVEKGELSVDKARVLAAAPAHVQKEIAEEYEIDGMSADDLRQHILEELVPAETAAFDLAKYKGGWHDEGKKRYFTDVEQFNKLQAAARDELLAMLRKEWPGAKIIEALNVYDWRWADTGGYVGNDENKGNAAGKFKVAREKCTAIVWLDRAAKLRSAAGVALSGAFPNTSVSTSRPGASSGGPAGEPAHKKRYRIAYNDAVRASVAANTDLGLRILLTRFIDGTTRATYDHGALKKAHEAILPKDLVPKANAYQEREKLTIWNGVAKLKPGQVVEALAKYTALSLDWNYQSYGPKGPSALTLEVARVAKTKLPKPGDFKPKAKAKAAPKAKTKNTAATAKPKPAAKKPAKKKAARK